MVSTSSSPQLSAHIHYDVFISHRGPDLKNTLASHLYYTLTRCGYRAFLDRTEMQAGERIDAQIEHAITNAAVHIALFSHRYAESPWCLDELTSMMKYPERILPVFYNVEPSDLSRLDKDGPYRNALQSLEEKRDGGKPRFDSETLQKWRKALSDVPLRSGYVFNGDEGELGNKIVEDVLKRLNKAPLLDVLEHPVGLNEVAEHFEKKMLSDGVQNVIVAGIVGTGGIGKTTLAIHIFHTRRSDYDRSCFLEDVRSQNSLTELQSKLLSDLSGDKRENCKIDGPREGRAKLRSQRLSSFRALVILDNIDDESQLNALFVVKDVLRTGSLVIITSRDKGLLERFGVPMYDIRELGEQHRQELFCKHAFGQGFPKEGFEDLVESFLRKCGGLPLSLKVFGGTVKGNDDRIFWKHQLKKISEVLPSDIEKRLKISYDLLDENDQEIFVDIACFFIGEDGNMASKIWDGCGLHGLIGLHTLRSKCLVELDSNNCIKMHDHLRDLGRKIAEEESSKPRRLWQPVDINDLLEKRIAIRGINRMVTLRQVPSFWKLWSRSKPGRGGVSGLKLLEVEGESFSGVLGKASGDLVWLRWDGCPYPSLPRWLPMDKLSVLELRRRKFRTLWHDNQIPTKLRELLVTSAGLVRFPNSIGRLQYLDKIVLSRDNSVESLPDEFCELHSLRYLQLECEKLRLLPERFGNLTNLEHLDLSWCRSLHVLPNSFSRFMRLQHLNLSLCWSLMIEQEFLGNISSLEHVDFTACLQLAVLPTGLIRQAFLKAIYLRQTRLKELPNEIGELKNLKILSLEGKCLESLPPSIWNLTGLTTLHLQDCRGLKCLPECGIEDKLPSAAEEYSGGGIDHLKTLEDLSISNCPLRKVTPFTSILRKDVDFKEPAGLLPNLKYLTLTRTKISKISITEDVCPNLKHLNLSYNPHLVEVEVPLQTMERLMLNDCSALKRLTGFSLPAKLSTFHAVNCGELEELPNLESMSCLKVLDVYGCGKLKAIGGAAHLGCLEMLDAGHCLELQSLVGLEELQRLKWLCISAGNVDIWNSILFLQRLPSYKLSRASFTTLAVPAEESRLESILNSVDFPLVLLKFSRRVNIVRSYISMELPGRPISCNGVIVCFVKYQPSKLWDCQSRRKNGSWITARLFTRDSALAKHVHEGVSGNRSWRDISRESGFRELEADKGWMVIESRGGGGGQIFQLWNKLITAIDSKTSIVMR